MVLLTTPLQQHKYATMHELPSCVLTCLQTISMQSLTMHVNLDRGAAEISTRVSDDLDTLQAAQGDKPDLEEQTSLSRGCSLL